MSINRAICFRLTLNEEQIKTERLAWRLSAKSVACLIAALQHVGTMESVLMEVAEPKE